MYICLILWNAKMNCAKGEGSFYLFWFCIMTKSPKSKKQQIFSVKSLLLFTTNTKAWTCVHLLETVGLVPVI
jgi:hypothetical protein